MSCPARAEEEPPARRRTRAATTSGTLPAIRAIHPPLDRSAKGMPSLSAAAVIESIPALLVALGAKRRHGPAGHAVVVPEHLLARRLRIHPREGSGGRKRRADPVRVVAGHAHQKAPRAPRRGRLRGQVR